MKKSILLSALLLTTSAVIAQQDKLDALDTDKDGRISIEEAASDPILSAVFAELDADKDGYLTTTELAEH